MEFEENAESKSIIHSVQSVPILSSAETTQTDNENIRKSSKTRRVSFASASNLEQYLEPINPFDSLVPISNSQELANLYRSSCEKHNTTPIPSIIEHLSSINLDSPTTVPRAEILNLKHETLTHESCEALEELFKRVKYKVIDFTSCSLDDVSASAIFDMIEYYEACNELNISENPGIKNRGWQSCINMIKRSQALHSLFTRGTALSDGNALALGNALLTSYIYTLKLERCGLTGRPILCLCGALQKNKILKELCLANNELNHNDAFHIGNVLKSNHHLQLLDISNNDIQDEGFRHIAEALSYQSVHINQSSSSVDSLLSNKFDFSDLTANLNNINNNRQRFCATPPPRIHVAADDSNTSSINNNNNSISQCDNSKQEEGRKNETTESVGSGKLEVVSEGVAMVGSKNETKSEESPMKEKFKYTTASLSPISHGYDDTTTNHQVFNARSPERSFSSESLCSETSIESNDSKSSIRLIETKFQNKNGTLERQNSNYVPVADILDKQLTGLQVLIFWNNNLTMKCAPSAADLIESTENLQIINFGHNSLSNEFIFDIKLSLKRNRSLISFGLQSTDLTSDGIKVLSEVIQFAGNATLQRIDLRNNEISIDGLKDISEALKSNKNIIRIDLDEKAKNVIFENNSEYQRWISTIKQQCAHNENPPEPQEAAKATTTIERMKRNNMTKRKISLTCSSVKTPQKQLLEPKKNSRLRTPSPLQSPISSPLQSPSRSRFQVSRVSESSSGVSSKLTSSTSPSPSSSSSSPTFFPSNSRFRVITVSEPYSKTKLDVVSQNKLMRSESKPEQSKEIDIPLKSSQSAPAKFIAPSNFYNNSSLLSSPSIDQLDYEVKNFIDIDSCSSFSSSIESIDRQTDLSSTESFDLVDKSPIVVEPLKITSWIKSENYPATLDKLLNLFQHPTSIFVKTSPESTLSSSPSTGLAAKSVKLSQAKDEKEKNIGMGQKENSFSGFFNSLVNMAHKKGGNDEKNETSTILQNISPENTVGKVSASSQMILESLPKSVKQELKENISPDNTVSFSGIEKQQHQRSPTTKVLFVVGEGEGSLDIPDPLELSTGDETSSDEVLEDIRPSLGDMKRETTTNIHHHTRDSADDQGLDVEPLGSNNQQ
ncbi:CLUMA_CG009650, isoform A [Clunio marinus]|uniref:CLUMA_CG009650, isoform A n=1 Tax=Clunio marinus TaxID=568069 RepID=A0A1J1I7D5_9DIPT|nr:CLUMA_CG009650, isoform A [Clunio marinus]